MADPRTTYLDALKLYEEARDALSTVIDPANRIASTLARTWNVDFGEMPESRHQSPREVFAEAKQRKTVDLRQWPTAEQIEAGVRDCKQKYAAMKEAWDSLPEQDRSGLRPLSQR